MMRTRSHSGYVFLVTVLMIGAIASTTLLSLLLLGWAAEQNGVLVERSMRSFEQVQVCAERTLRSLRLDPTYAGDETFKLDYGNCTIRKISGAGNINRIVCVESTVGTVTRRLEISISRLFPLITISSWQEVSAFTKCP